MLLIEGVWFRRKWRVVTLLFIQVKVVHDSSWLLNLDLWFILLSNMKKLTLVRAKCTSISFFAFDASNLH
jgi:hypothetical protein